MQSFRILFFRESVLDHAEEVRVRDVLEAIERASDKAPELRAEVWSHNGRVGEVPHPLPPRESHRRLTAVLRYGIGSQCGMAQQLKPQH